MASAAEYFEVWGSHMEKTLGTLEEGFNQMLNVLEQKHFTLRQLERLKQYLKTRWTEARVWVRFALSAIDVHIDLRLQN